MLGNGGNPNCFATNRSGSSLPADLTTVQACGSAVGIDGDPSVGADLAIPVPDALDRLAALGPRPDYRTMPAPESQPGTPDPLPTGLRPFRPEGIGSVAPIALVALIAVVAAIGIVTVARRRAR
jgi:hypothetical protein